MSFQRDFLDLMKMLYRGRLDYDIYADRNINPHKMLIPPMLFQIFVENAIKYGALSLETGGRISINYYLEDAMLW